ncbi:MAG: Fis family transcriptional regulator [bacterium]|nr:MAG: Fis family transcriptional regulator [bacterium]
MVAGTRHPIVDPDAPSCEGEIHQVRSSRPFIGHSVQSRHVLAMVGRVAATEATVLIRGPSGVGKELIAQAVHRQSRRADRPLVAVDCASLHENLLQSELFGHERGAFTGAIQLKHGLFEVADGGSIFLDEIAEMTPALQAKLLRVIESGTLRRVGGTADIRVNVRVIAATNRSLESMLAGGAFREDLYYRLNVFSITIPPLNERVEDIPPLVEYFIRTSPLIDRRRVRLATGTLDRLLGYSWPGNVRELANVIERALILCDDEVLEPRHLPADLVASPAKREPESGPHRMRLPDLETVELRHIQRAMDYCHGHRREAASILGISERNLYRRLKDLAAFHARGMTSTEWGLEPRGRDPEPANLS